MKKSTFWMMSTGVLALVGSAFAAVPLSRELRTGSSPDSAESSPTLKAGVPIQGEAFRVRKNRGVFTPFVRNQEVISMSGKPSPEFMAKVSSAKVKLRGAMTDNSEWYSMSAEDRPYGIYELSTTPGDAQYSLVIQDPRFYVMDAVYTGDKLWISHAVEDPSTYEVKSMTYYTFNPETWEVVKEQVGDKSLSLTTSAWVAEDEVAYCSYYSGSHRFACLSIEDGQLINIGTLDNRLTAMAAHSDGTLYGVDDKGALVVLNKNTGKVSRTVGNTGLVSYWRTSAAIDSANDIMYYIDCGSSKSSLYAIDLETAEATKLYDFANAEQIIGLYVTTDNTDPKVPAAASDLTLDFPAGSLSGKVSFNAPSTLYDGSAPSGLLNYTVSEGDVKLAEGECSWGQACSVDLSFDSAAKHDISVVLSNEAGQSPAVKVSGWIGPDAPCAPTNAKIAYSDGKFTVSWTAPTEGTNGGYINAAGLVYDVVRNTDGTKIAEGTSLTSVTDDVVEPVNNIVAYTYTITPISDGVAGESVTTSKKSIGYFLPPYSNGLESTAAITGFVVLDANKDGKKWSYNTASKALRIQYNSSKAMDDYFFTPEMLLEAGKTYTLSFDTRAHNNSDNERLEAFVSTGTTASSLVEKIIDPTDVVTNEWISVSGTFSPRETKKYRFAVHGISDKNKYYLYVTKINVSAGTEITAPASVSDLKAVAAPDGTLKADISFKAPTEDAGGAALTSLEKIELLRNGEVIKTWDNPQPGSELTYSDEDAPARNVVYSVVAYNLGGAGVSAQINVFVGFDAPVAPSDVKASVGSNSGQAVITWTAPAVDLQGNQLSPDNITYSVVRRLGDNTETIKTGLTGNSYTDQAVDADKEQDFFAYGVIAETTGGSSQAISTGLIPLGKPYEVPFRESFSKARTSYVWALDSNNPSAGWLLGQDTSIDEIDSEDGDNGLAIMEAMTKGSTATLYSGSIAIPAEGKPTLAFAYYNHDSLNKLKVVVAETGSETGYVVSEITLNPDAEEGWINVPVSLDDYKGKNVQLYFTAEVVNTTIFVLDNIRIENRYDNDLAIRSVSVPSRITKGSDYSVSVAYENRGLQNASDYNLVLLINGEEAARKSGVGINAAEAAKVTFDCRLGADSEAEELNHKVQIIYDADSDVVNNISQEYVSKAVDPQFPLPQNLEANVTGKDVALTWDNPDLTVAPMQPVEESCENFTAFSTGLAGSEVFDDYVGDWTIIDNDGFIPYSITSQNENVTFPNSGCPIGFILFDSSIIGLDEWNAHSGDKMFASFASEYGPNDDWMISPMLGGQAQTVSFWAKSLTDYYGSDSFQVWYSTTDTRISSFVRATTVDNAPIDWTEYKVDLPEGARYFAIRCTSDNTFAFFVDDISYIPAHPNDGLELKGFRVYRDGVNVADVTEPAFTDPAKDVADYAYRLSALYNRGESSLTDHVSVSVTGVSDVYDSDVVNVNGLTQAVKVTGAKGKHVSIVSTSGVVVYDGIADKHVIKVPVASGIYVVTAGDDTFKISVK